MLRRGNPTHSPGIGSRRPPQSAAGKVVVDALAARRSIGRLFLSPPPFTVSAYPDCSWCHDRSDRSVSTLDNPASMIRLPAQNGPSVTSQFHGPIGPSRALDIA